MMLSKNNIFILFTINLFIIYPLITFFGTYSYAEDLELPSVCSQYQFINELSKDERLGEATSTDCVQTIEIRPLELGSIQPALQATNISNLNAFISKVMDQYQANLKQNIKVYQDLINCLKDPNSNSNCETKTNQLHQVLENVGSEIKKIQIQNFLLPKGMPLSLNPNLIDPSKISNQEKAQAEEETIKFFLKEVNENLERGESPYNEEEVRSLWQKMKNGSYFGSGRWFVRYETMKSKLKKTIDDQHQMAIFDKAPFIRFLSSPCSWTTSNEQQVPSWRNCPNHQQIIQTALQKSIDQFSRESALTTQSLERHHFDTTDSPIIDFYRSSQGTRPLFDYLTLPKIVDQTLEKDKDNPTVLKQDCSALAAYYFYTKKKEFRDSNIAKLAGAATFATCLLPLPPIACFVSGGMEAMQAAKGLVTSSTVSSAASSTNVPKELGGAISEDPKRAQENEEKRKEKLEEAALVVLGTIAPGIPKGISSAKKAAQNLAEKVGPKRAKEIIEEKIDQAVAQSKVENKIASDLKRELTVIDGQAISEEEISGYVSSLKKEISFAIKNQQRELLEQILEKHGLSKNLIPEDQLDDIYALMYGASKKGIPKEEIERVVKESLPTCNVSR